MTDKCDESVPTQGIRMNYHRCGRLVIEAGKCKIHSASYRAARDKKQYEKDRPKRENRYAQIYGPDFLKALRKIEAGEPNPRRLAEAAIKKYEKALP